MQVIGSGVNTTVLLYSQIEQSHTPLWINGIYKAKHIIYLPWIKSQTFLLNASLERAIEYDYRNECLIHM